MDDVDEILDTLAETIEVPERPEEDDVLAVLVRAILSQATSSANREQAFGNLLDTFSGDWELMADAEVDEIADAIRVGGLANQKSKRVAKILNHLRETTGECSLQFLARETTEDALEILNAFPGVGPQTATFTVGWALGRDVCPVNTGVKRIAIRLGWIEKGSDKKMHRDLHAELPDGRRFEAHQLLVRHARLTCLPEPLCDACSVSGRCDYAEGS